MGAREREIDMISLAVCCRWLEGVMNMTILLTPSRHIKANRTMSTRRPLYFICCIDIYSTYRRQTDSKNGKILTGMSEA